MLAADVQRCMYCACQLLRNREQEDPDSFKAARSIEKAHIRKWIAESALRLQKRRHRKHAVLGRTGGSGLGSWLRRAIAGA
jgi:hypothetical protein